MSGQIRQIGCLCCGGECACLSATECAECPDPTKTPTSFNVALSGVTDIPDGDYCCGQDDTCSWVYDDGTYRVTVEVAAGLATVKAYKDAGATQMYEGTALLSECCPAADGSAADCTAIHNKPCRLVFSGITLCSGCVLYGPPPEDSINSIAATVNRAINFTWGNTDSHVITLPDNWTANLYVGDACTGDIVSVNDDLRIELDCSSGSVVVQFWGKYDTTDNFVIFFDGTIDLAVGSVASDLDTCGGGAPIVAATGGTAFLVVRAQPPPEGIVNTYGDEAGTAALDSCCSTAVCAPCLDLYVISFTADYWFANTDCSGAPDSSGSASENATPEGNCDSYRSEFSLVLVTRFGGVWKVYDALTSQEVGEIASDGNGCPTGAFTSYGCVTDFVNSTNWSACSMAAP